MLGDVVGDAVQQHAASVDLAHATNEGVPDLDHGGRGVHLGLNIAHAIGLLVEADGELRIPTFVVALLHELIINGGRSSRSRIVGHRLVHAAFPSREVAAVTHEEVDQVAARHIAEDVAEHLRAVVAVVAGQQERLALVVVGRVHGRILLHTLAIVGVVGVGSGIPIRQVDAVHHIKNVLHLEGRNDLQAGENRLVKRSAGQTQHAIDLGGERSLIRGVAVGRIAVIAERGRRHIHAGSHALVEVVRESHVENAVLILLRDVAAREPDHAEERVDGAGVRHDHASVDLLRPLPTRLLNAPAIVVRVANAAAEAVDLVGNLDCTAERSEAGQLGQAGEHSSAHAAAPVDHDDEAVRLALANVHRSEEQFIVVAVLMDASHIKNPRSGKRRLLKLRRRLLALKVCDHASHRRLVVANHRVDHIGLSPNARLLEPLHHFLRRDVSHFGKVDRQIDRNSRATHLNGLVLASRVNLLLRLACSVHRIAFIVLLIAFALHRFAVGIVLELDLLTDVDVGRGHVSVDVLADIHDIIERLAGCHAIHEHLLLRREGNFGSGVHAQLEVQVDLVDQRHIFDAAFHHAVKQVGVLQQGGVAADEGAAQTGELRLHLAFDASIFHDVQEQLGSLKVLGVDSVAGGLRRAFVRRSVDRVADLMGEQHLVHRLMRRPFGLQHGHGQQAITDIKGRGFRLTVVDDTDVLRSKEASKVVVGVGCECCHSAVSIRVDGASATSFYKKGRRFVRLS